MYVKCDNDKFTAVSTHEKLSITSVIYLEYDGRSMKLCRNHVWLTVGVKQNKSDTLLNVIINE